MQDNIIKLPSRVQWSCYDNLLNEINEKKKNTMTLYLDFSSVNRIYPNGIIPIIAEIKTLEESIDIRCIGITSKLYKYMDKMGWINLIKKHIDEIFIQDDVQIGNDVYCKLVAFNDYNTLNKAITEIIKHCSDAIEFAPGSITAFEWVLNELTDNVINHSKATIGLFQTVINKKRINIVICDNGIGIVTKIKNKFGLNMSDMEAVIKATQKGVTSGEGQGNGLAGARDISKETEGYFNIVSGTADWSVDNGIEKKDVFKSYFNGTYIELHFNTDKEINCANILNGEYDPITVLESYLDEDGNDVIFKLKDHANNFGNRKTAENFRIKLRNIIQEFEGINHVIIDFDGVNMISSSFADEFIGKMLAEYNIIDYMKKFNFININQVCKSIIGGVVSQRLKNSQVSF